MENLEENIGNLTFNENLGYRKQEKGLATQSIHAGQKPEKWMCRPIIPPIFTSVCYEQTIPRNMTDFFYTRLGNPTRSVLEECLAALEKAKYAITFSSGVAAIMTVITTLKNGDGIIASKQFYAGTLDGLAIAERIGFDVQYIDFTDLKNLEDALKPNTKLVWTESCMNPTMQVMDIKAISDLVHAKSEAIVLADNTFLTPYYCRPLELGADIALYSLTKYFSGHSDILGGSVTMNCEELYKTVRYGQGAFGTMLSPFDCYLVNRSVKTLALRMEQHSKNSYQVAKFLQSHPVIEKVNHPVLPTHKGHEIALKQFSGHSGVFSFYLKENSKEKVVKFFNGLKFIPICTSLGGIETTIAHPREMSHPKFSDEECFAMGVTYGLIRISVGIEDCEDIIKDLKSALDGIVEDSRKSSDFQELRKKYEV